MSQRTERVDELLRQEIGAIVTREVADPRIGFATITSVETTDDLRHAKVWVSVIGQPAEREAAVAALRHAMPFVRHELGTRLRIKRIPDLHVHLDDTAERGTRILQLLAELEAGSIPDPDVAVGGVAADAGRPAAARGRPGRGAAVGGPHPAGAAAAAHADRAAPDDATQGRSHKGARASHSMTRRPRRRTSTPSRRRSSTGCAARDACWRSATRTRTPTRSAPRSGSSASSRRSAAPPTPSARTRSRRSTRSCSGVERFRTDPDPDRALRPARHLRLRLARADRRGRRASRRPVRATARGSSSTTTPRTTPPRPPTGSSPTAAATCEMVTLLAGRLGVAARRRRWRARGRADGRDRHGHRDLRPSERDAADAAWSRRRWSRPARRCPTSRGGSTGPSPTPSSGCSASSSIGWRAPTTAGSSGRALTDADYRRDRRRAGAFGGHHRPPLAGRGRRGRDPVQGGRRARRRGSASGPSRAASTRPS